MANFMRTKANFILEIGSDLYEYEVLTDARDLTAWELYARRNKLGNYQENTMIANVFMSWHALKRSKSLPDRLKAFENFQEAFVTANFEDIEVRPTKAAPTAA